MSAFTNSERNAAASCINHEAERAVLAALIRNPDGKDIIRLGIHAGLFTLETTREAFTGITRLIADGIEPDPATLRNVISQATIVELETSLIQHASAANLPVYVKLLKDCEQERRIVAARAALAQAAKEDRDPHELHRLLESLEQAQQQSGHCAAIAPLLRGVTSAQLEQARLTPRCIVENYLYANLALVCAAGGTGKTTMLIYEAVCIAIGRDLWGCKVKNGGKTLFITAEDSEEMFYARLREVMNAMLLTDWERRRALESITVWDVSGELIRLAELDKAGNIQLTGLADQIVHAYRNENLAQIVFDPAISFSPGERVINDGEQAIVTACRRIIRGLDCCVRLVAHTGKANARNGAIDQYASRGGTALPDGCRMVAVLSDAKTSTLTPPDGFELAPGDSGFVMARAKLSYAPPQPNVWIRRTGYSFEFWVEERRSSDEIIASDAAKVEAFISDELALGRTYTARALEESGAIKISRNRLRAALVNLETSGAVVERGLPAGERKGARKTYLHPRRYCAAGLGAIAAENAPTPPEILPIAPIAPIAPPYRESKNGAIDAAVTSPVFLIAPETDGAIAAQWRNSDESTNADALAAPPTEPASNDNGKTDPLLLSPLAARLKQRVEAAGGGGLDEAELKREAGKAGQALYQQTLAKLVKAHGWTRCNGRWITPC